MTRHTPRFTRLSAADRRLGLIEAALACMADGGIMAFTVDRVCARAGVSRGLITHHFGGMAGLLTAVYAHLYAQAIPSPDALPTGPGRLDAVLTALFDTAQFNRATLNMWLTMWGAISNTPGLAEEHRRQYAEYRDMVTAAVAVVAAANARKVDAEAVARALICLIDGLGLQHCIDPDQMPADQALQTCRDFLSQSLGPV